VVSQVQEWEETFIKGLFVKVNDGEGFSQTISKWYYTFKNDKK
jgi:hypothetical protein